MGCRGIKVLIDPGTCERRDFEMFELWRNTDYKKTMVRIFILFGVMLLVLAFILGIFINRVKLGIIEQDAAFAGIVMKNHPELEQDLVAAIQGRVTDTEINEGYSILTEYGINKWLLTDRTPVLKDLYGLVFVIGTVFLLLTGIGVCMIITGRSKTVYDRIDEISKLAEQVVDGDFTQKLSSEGEGSFAILGHRFNQMTNRLKLTMESLKSEKTFLRDIIADISHQLKTPLSTLVINQDLLLNNPDMDIETRIHFLESGSHQLIRLQWLIQSLLKMARLESGSISFKNEKVILLDIAGEAFETLDTMAHDADVTLSISETAADAFCIGDKDWLIEALINIIKNSIEHTPTNGTVSVGLFKTRLTSGIIIKDNGEGIDTKDLPHIFERFYRGSGPNKPSSVGIGLSLSMAIIDGHGGSIRVQSEKGKGSEFTITFLLNA